MANMTSSVSASQVAGELASAEGRQTDQHHLGEVLGDQGGLADAKGHQYAHLLTAVVHPQQQHETEHEHGRDGEKDLAVGDEGNLVGEVATHGPHLPS